MFKGCCKADLTPREFFLFGARLAIGIWLFYAGLVKWIGGPAAFVGYIESEFGKTWSPAPLNTVLGWFIVIAEPVIGLWLISGIRQRCAWTAAAVLMFLLVLGMTILMKPEVIANFQYFFLCLACAAWSTNECCGSKAESCCAAPPPSA